MPKDETPHEIERRIEKERSELSATLSEIQSRFTPDAMINEVTRTIRANGEDIGRSVARSVKENPVALAVTGVGLAWLIFGNNRSSKPAHALPEYNPEMGRSVGPKAGSTYERDDVLGADERRPDAERIRAAAYAGQPTGASYAGRPADDRAAHYPSWYTADDELGDDLPPESTGEFSEFGHAHQAVVAERESEIRSKARDATGQAKDSAHRAGDAASGAAHRAGEYASDAKHRAGDAAHDAGDRARYAAGQASGRMHAGAASARAAARRARWKVSDALHSGEDYAKRLRDRLAEGTEDLSNDARERIIAARARAIDARRHAQDATRSGVARGREVAIRGKDKAVDFFEDQPLVAGALAIAVGAAIAGALPRTRREDEWFGDTSDHLRDEAERIFNEERAKAERVARAAMDEAGSVMREEGEKADHAAKDALEAAKSDAKDAAKRVEDRAKSEADKENLGKPNV
ncbi:DUF3619 family protein [Pseudoroseicyclus tamaricis]|uniref:DUF3619 family protein n=1 Tax=Pseudoroseicyclus tamaricis TaxID=2705421 RepID=A0A6B2JLH1_9RHOB|nr:DUF3619 family protein [Pseudoroseicyclus tamaricis]NDV02403.1 DUF3619 family protein [Pseudoroseicyclus tamaricis]